MTDIKDQPAERAVASQTGKEELDPDLPTMVAPWQPPQYTPHALADKIVEQVDFYFSDENLRQDAHLLGLIKQGNGSVSLGEVLSWRKMRKYRPMTAVREALRKSKIVEVVGNKRLRRREPLLGPIYVTPRVSQSPQNKALLVDKPWLTRGMLKPTGFEEYATDGPIKPEEYAKDREAYDASNSFTHRIEIAIAGFCARRKMHQHTRQIFDRFLWFGGFDTSQRQFNGGIDDKSMEDYTKREIAGLTSSYVVSDMVMNGFGEDGSQDKATWTVDFEEIAKAFFSSQFMSRFNWEDDKEIVTATMVVRNFYNYLLHHDVCPEYREQIHAARKVCDLAEEELPRLSKIDHSLPGDFNSACSTIFGGKYSHMSTTGTWFEETDKRCWPEKEAHIIVATGIAAYGTENQLTCLKSDDGVKRAEVVSTEETGIEVVSVECSDGEAKDLYEDSRLSNTVVRPMGKVRCRRWDMPQAAPRDLPASVKLARKAQEFEFLIEASMLHYYCSGLKMEVEIWELRNGIKWIDRVVNVYPSFFVWLVNEQIRTYKEPGPPTLWMKRLVAKGKESHKHLTDPVEHEESEDDGK